MNNNEICVLAFFIECIPSRVLYTSAGIFNTYWLYVYPSFRQTKDYDKAPRLSALAPDQCNDRHSRLVAPPRIRFPYTDYLQLGKSLHEDKSHRLLFNISPWGVFYHHNLPGIRARKSREPTVQGASYICDPRSRKNADSPRRNDKICTVFFYWLMPFLVRYWGTENGPRVVSPLRGK